MLDGGILLTPSRDAGLDELVERGLVRRTYCEKIRLWRYSPTRAAYDSNPYQGDAVDLARYRKAREKWERDGRRGPPPPLPPERHASENAALSEEQWDDIILDEEETLTDAHRGWAVHDEYAYAFTDGGPMGWTGYIDGPGEFLEGRGPEESYELGPYDDYAGARAAVRRKLTELTGTAPVLNPKGKKPMKAKSKSNPKAYQPGELVRETANFLRSTGRVSSSRIDGVVVGAGSIGPYVVWSDDDLPVQINAANIEKKKSSVPAGQALSAARLATGLPIGKFSADGYKIYVRGGKFATAGGWELASNFVSGDWEKSAARMHDDLNRDVVVLSPDDSYVVLSMRSWAQNPKARAKREHGRGGTRSRAAKNPTTTDTRARQLAARLARGG